MSISVNSETIQFIDNETISGLMERMNYVFPLVVVLLDGQIIDESDFGSEKIKDGTKIEIIHLTSGG